MHRGDFRGQWTLGDSAQKSLNTWRAGKAERRKGGEAGAANLVSWSKGFGGVMGPNSEKICWGELMILSKSQKPTLACLRENGLSYRVGWGGHLTRVVLWKPEGRTKVDSQGARRRSRKPLHLSLQSFSKESPDASYGGSVHQGGA